MTKTQPTKGELQDELKARDRRIGGEIDEQRDLISRLRENVEDVGNTIERWCEAFDMVQNDDGTWGWGPYVREAQECKIELEWRREEHNALVQKHNALVKKWNMKMLGGNPVGRPLAASEAQIMQVLQLRNAGTSLRGIADETNLGLNTVRTIIDKKHHAGRVARRARTLMRKRGNDPEAIGWEHEEWEIERKPYARQKASKFKRQKHTIDALPKQVQRVIEEGQALIKEAKGLGRN